MVTASRRKPGRPVGASTGEGRAALLRAARELLAERGMARITVREVAERAGVQAGLVHYYFGSKEGLLREVVADVAAGLRVRVQAAAGIEGSPAERLEALVTAVVSALAEDPYAPRLIVEQVFFSEGAALERFVEEFARPNLGVIASILQEGRESGSLRAVDPTFFVPSAMGSMLFFFLAQPMLARVFGIDHVDPKLAGRFAESVSELLLHGISAPTAEEGA